MKLIACVLIVLIHETAISQSNKYWIFFSDKPNNTVLKKSIVENLPERTVQRRLKNASIDIADEYDLPIDASYIAQIESSGIIIQRRSKWFNAVTAYLDASGVNTVKQLPFVKSIRLVANGVKDNVTRSRNQSSSALNLQYGASQKQNATINVVNAHILGYSGKGVLIGMIDTGFNLTHEAFDSIKVAGQYDFIENDTDVSEPVGSKGGSSHGTQVLSTIAGYAGGHLIGTAFGATFLLARTEDDDGIGEKAEEDQWIEGLEWLEEQGADIVSSSISFFDEFQNSVDNYSLSDLNGKTALTTLATNIAFDKGVLVFNSAGNMGSRGARYLGTPSDGKKMIAVGAVNGDSSKANFSSYGPTADGRKKPDVSALGRFVRVVAVNDDSGYDNFDGTSLSTPLVAGLAALALEAHPDWSSKQLYDALRKTSSLASGPDNEIGYGIPDAVRLINYSPSGSSIPLIDIKSFPNPANATVSFSFKSLTNSSYSLSIYNVLGEKVTELAKNESISFNQTVTKTWLGKNLAGKDVASGVYFYRIVVDGNAVVQKLMIVK
ncbi:S8 family peptidase [bacterium]|nr:S8 family peptidase [bacterium]